MEFDESKVCYGMVSIILENMQPCKDSIFVFYFKNESFDLEKQKFRFGMVSIGEQKGEPNLLEMK